jgi:hypothetical protein
MKRLPVNITNAGVRSAEARKSVPKKGLVSKKTLSIKPDQRCMDILAKNWARLRDMTTIHEEARMTYRGYDREDILIEAFEYIIRSSQVKGATEKTILDLFIYRYHNLLWVAKKEAALERRMLPGDEIDRVMFASDDEDIK